MFINNTIPPTPPKNKQTKKTLNEHSPPLSISGVKLNHFYGGGGGGGGIKRISSTRFLFMDTVNAKVGSLFSVSISLIAILFLFSFFWHR